MSFAARHGGVELHVSEVEWLDFGAAVTVIARKGKVPKRGGGTAVSKGAKWRARRRNTLMDDTEKVIGRLVATMSGEVRTAGDVAADGDGNRGPVERDDKREGLVGTVVELEEMLSAVGMDEDEAGMLEQLLLDVKDELRILDEAEAAAESMRDPMKELLAIAGAARQMLDLSARGAGSRGAVRSMGGMAPVLALLDSDSAEIATLAAVTLGNLCCDEPATRELLVEEGAVAALLARGVASFETVLQDASVFALGNLVADCTPARAQLREAGGIDALVVLLASPQSSVRKQSAWALSNACDHEPLNRTAARMAGAISALVGCLDHHNGEVVRASVTCIGVLCVDEPLCRTYFRQAGGLHRLQQILKNESSDGVVIDRKLVRQAVWTLGHATRGERESKSVLREAGVVTTLVGMMHTRSRGMREQAGFALRQLCSEESEYPDDDQHGMMGYDDQQQLTSDQMHRGERREMTYKQGRARAAAEARRAAAAAGWSTSSGSETESDSSWDDSDDGYSYSSGYGSGSSHSSYTSYGSGLSYSSRSGSRGGSVSSRGSSSRASSQTHSSGGSGRGTRQDGAGVGARIPVKRPRKARRRGSGGGESSSGSDEDAKGGDRRPSAGGAGGKANASTPVGGTFCNSVLCESGSKNSHSYDKRPTYLRAAEMQAADKAERGGSTGGGGRAKKHGYDKRPTYLRAAEMQQADRAERSGGGGGRRPHEAEASKPTSTRGARGGGADDYRSGSRESRSGRSGGGGDGRSSRDRPGSRAEAAESGTQLEPHRMRHRTLELMAEADGRGGGGGGGGGGGAGSKSVSFGR